MVLIKRRVLAVISAILLALTLLLARPIQPDVASTPATIQVADGNGGGVGSGPPGSG